MVEVVVIFPVVAIFFGYAYFLYVAIFEAVCILLLPFFGSRKYVGIKCQNIWAFLFKMSVLFFKNLFKVGIC